MTWFLLKDEEICGPFETAHIFENCDDQTLIWGPGMNEWTDKQAWKSFLDRPKEETKAVERGSVGWAESELAALVGEWARCAFLTACELD